MTSVFHIVLSFVYGTQLTLIVVSYVPIVCLMNSFITKVTTDSHWKMSSNDQLFQYHFIKFYCWKKLEVILSTSELNVYARAANVVEEVLSGIRTVFAFGGEKIEVERYKQYLKPAEKIVGKKGMFASIKDASIRLLYFTSYALTFWFGARWVLEDKMKYDKRYTLNALIIVWL